MGDEIYRSATIAPIKTSYGTAIRTSTFKTLRSRLNEWVPNFIKGTISTLLSFAAMHWKGLVDLSTFFESMLAIPFGMAVLAVFQIIWDYATAPRRIYHQQQDCINEKESALSLLKERLRPRLELYIVESRHIKDDGRFKTFRIGMKRLGDPGKSSVRAKIAGVEAVNGPTSRQDKINDVVNSLLTISDGHEGSVPLHSLIGDEEVVIDIARETPHKTPLDSTFVILRSEGRTPIDGDGYNIAISVHCDDGPTIQASVFLGKVDGISVFRMLPAQSQDSTG
jgi:hypothetical protein